MDRQRLTGSALFLLILLAGCATTSAPKNQSQVAPGANLAAYSTFGWSDPAGDGIAEAPMRILDVNIRDAIRAEMLRRGYEENETKPDLRIDYETAAADKIRSSPVRFGIGMGSWGGNMGGSVSMGTPSVQSYQEGRLVIHIADAAKNQEIWNGSVSGKVDRSKLDAEAVARVVGLAMESYPPRGGAAVSAPETP